MTRIGIVVRYKNSGESWRLIDEGEAPVILEEWLDESKYLMINGDVLNKDLIHSVSFKNQFVK